MRSRHFIAPTEADTVAGGPPIIHIDGYRLSENRREWLEIGIPEMLAGPGVKLIEWPKRDFEEFEDGHIEIQITVREDDAREIMVASLNNRSED
jgi:tRNA A37 threonylcarbamoyladenosine biosynthesis protein TsaE